MMPPNEISTTPCPVHEVPAPAFRINECEEAFVRDFCPYKGSPDPIVVWRAAWHAALADLAGFIHYPEHWDTAAYPTLQSAVREVLACAGCSACKDPEAYGIAPPRATNSIAASARGTGAAAAFHEETRP